MEQELRELPARDFVRHKNTGAVPEGWCATVTDTRPEPAAAPRMTVVIPTSDAYRDGRFPALLAQLAEQDFQDFERCVVQGDNRQGRAINTGAALGRGEYLLTLDDDTSLGAPDVLGRLVAVLDAHPDVGMAGGINTIPADAPFFVRRAMAELPRRSTPPVSEITDSDLAEHPLLLMRRELFMAVGGENELIPRGLDPYLRQEFRKAGARIVVVPGAVYTHLPPARFGSLVRQFYRNGAQSAYCQARYPQWAIETPDTHGAEFVPMRPLWYRVGRHAANLLGHAVRGHAVYAAANTAYAAGYLSERLRLRREKAHANGAAQRP